MIIASATQFHILLPWGQLIVQLRRLVVDSTIHLPPPALTHTLFEYCLNLNSHVIVNWDTDCKDAISDMLIVVTGPGGVHPARICYQLKHVPNLGAK